MAAGPWRVYNKAKEYIFSRELESTMGYWMALFTSSANSTTLTLDELGDMTGQVANGNGYVTGGVAMTGEAWAATSSDAKVMRFDSSNVTWTATGGSITAAYAVIYAKTTVGSISNPLLCHSHLNNSSVAASVTVTADNTLTVQMSTGGIFTLSGGTS